MIKTIKRQLHLINNFEKTRVAADLEQKGRQILYSY